MIENEINIDNKFIMRINFNLKKIGGTKEQIWLTATINGERARIYTKLLINPRFWVKTTRTQIGEKALESTSLNHVQNSENRNINKRLKEILGYCREYADLVSTANLMNDKPLEHTKKNFEEFIKAKICGVETNYKKYPKDFILAYIERKKLMVNKITLKTISNGTIYNHDNAFKRLEKFCNEKHLNLRWELFNNRFEIIFTAWMNEKQYSANTIAAQFSIIKVWLNEAEKEGIVIDKSYHHYLTKSHEVENVYLTEDEINRIYHIDFSKDEIKSQFDPKLQIEKTRDLFILACWTGLRYSDWHNLSHVEIIEDKYFKITTQKTNEEVIIPLHPIVAEILKKYGGQLPKSVDKAHTIPQIQLCAKIADINEIVNISTIKGGQVVRKTGEKWKFVTNHTARRSFATNMYLRKVPIQSIMAITGHKTEDNFRKYIKVNKLEHAMIVAKAFSNS